jgi:hypothetical protein
MTEAILERAESIVAGTTPMGRIGKRVNWLRRYCFWLRRGRVILRGRWLRLMGEVGTVAGREQGRPATVNGLLLHRRHLLWILCPGLIVVIELTFRMI